MGALNWNYCLSTLEAELSQQQFNTWVRPLHAIEVPDGLKLLAPNRFAVDWVKTNLLPRIAVLLSTEAAANTPLIHVEVGAKQDMQVPAVAPPVITSRARRGDGMVVGSRIQPDYSFQSFVVGKSNRLARDASF